VQIYIEGPNGRLLPLEGAALDRARTKIRAEDPTAFSDAYLDTDLCNTPEFLTFSGRLAAVGWLQRMVSNGVDAVAKKQARSQITGEHIHPDWEQESEIVLDEQIYVREDVSKISSGAVIASCAAALESLIGDLLELSDLARPRGLQQRTMVLVDNWPHLHQPERVRDDVKWIAQRRNAFAHSLLDEAEQPQSQLTFDADSAEEALQRAGAVGTALALATIAQR
jgi:hypothetical protein